VEKGEGGKGSHGKDGEKPQIHEAGGGTVDTAGTQPDQARARSSWRWGHTVPWRGEKKKKGGRRKGARSSPEQQGKQWRKARAPGKMTTAALTDTGEGQEERHAGPEGRDWNQEAVGDKKPQRAKPEVYHRSTAVTERTGTARHSGQAGRSPAETRPGRS